MTVKHATASTFLFRHHDRGTWQLALIRHPLFGKLMIPGGHVEPDESPAQAALREVAEETGLGAQFREAPGAPVPPGLGRLRVEQPWWMVEQPVPADNHLAGPHVHVDHLYVALADGARPAGSAAHPLSWHEAADLSGLDMFDDTRQLARWLFPRLG